VTNFHAADEYSCESLMRARARANEWLRRAAPRRSFFTKSEWK
jgi:hypothetical protein